MSDFHDPICSAWKQTPPVPDWVTTPCQCWLIDIVRTHIADQIHARRDSQSNAGAIQWNGAISCAEGIARGRRV